ncbi:MAG: orotate phosphoribosyltransferase [Beggiatoa sp. IS2]|nr:MAG: orotate phosphoribosyltransferase [Beggiatoa sp. IS2]
MSPDFLTFIIAQHILRFGDFTLKSGRKSPYFFDAGLFNTGKILAQLGRYYAATINTSHIDFDLLFGPAYKGIPLVATTAIALAEHYQRDIPYSFNRKEIKDHGEGGIIVGAPLRGRVLLIDDVITAGTAIEESVRIIQTQQAELVGVIIAFDRQERGQGECSAVNEIAQRYNIPIISILRLEEVLHYLQHRTDNRDLLMAMQQYCKQYGTF